MDISACMPPDSALAIVGAPLAWLDTDIDIAIIGWPKRTSPPPYMSPPYIPPLSESVELVGLAGAVVAEVVATVGSTVDND
jgi:hypothetical protein